MAVLMVVIHSRTEDEDNSCSKWSTGNMTQQAGQTTYRPTHFVSSQLRVRIRVNRYIACPVMFQKSRTTRALQAICSYYSSHMHYNEFHRILRKISLQLTVFA